MAEHLSAAVTTAAVTTAAVTTAAVTTAAVTTVAVTTAAVTTAADVGAAATSSTPMDLLLMATNLQRINRCLPLRIRFNRSSQLPDSPGLDQVGWLTAVDANCQGSKTGLTYTATFLDPIQVDEVDVDTQKKASKSLTVSIVPPLGRTWAKGSLCAFAHTCYYNWDVKGQVSHKSVYTTSSSGLIDIELRPNVWVNIKKAIPQTRSQLLTWNLSAFIVAQPTNPFETNPIVPHIPQFRRKLPGRGQQDINPSHVHKRHKNSQ